LLVSCIEVGSSDVRAKLPNVMERFIAFSGGKLPMVLERVMALPAVFSGAGGACL